MGHAVNSTYITIDSLDLQTQATMPAPALCLPQLWGLWRPYLLRNIPTPTTTMFMENPMMTLEGGKSNSFLNHSVSSQHIPCNAVRDIASPEGIIRC